jgi:zinc-ribbon domain
MPGRKSSKPKAPEICPVCGEDVPPGALACPECGADHNSGWREGADVYDAVDLPDEDFKYDEFVREEFGSSFKPTPVKTIWWITAVVLIVALVVIYVYAVD